ncbi:MAG: Glycosyl transferase, partial [Candidatus Giovannonibacteria bacterium GW2011_GWC2_44_8]
EKRNLARRQYEIEGLAIGTVGLVLPRKGTDTFVYLAKEFPKNKFLWFGKIYSGLLVKPPPKELPPNVLFSGFVSDVTAAFNALDIFIFPSYEENEGMVILEAAAIGLPIVVRDIPAYKGWLEHGENCLKAKSNEEFKRYIEMLLEDKNMRLKLGHGAKILAENKSIEALSKKVMDIYAKLG